MFSLSFWEVFFIICVALIVLKPTDIPVIARQVGKFISQIKSYFSDVTDMFDDGGKPKTKGLIADDGLEYEAYDVEEVFEDISVPKTKNVASKPKAKPKSKNKAKKASPKKRVASKPKKDAKKK